MSRVEATERFAELVSRPPSEIPLDQAALWLAAHARPDLDVAGELGRLDDLAAGCAGTTVEALMTHLFVDLGYRGNARNYYDPRNSYLDQVRARRLGIPITLSIQAIVVGRRLDLSLQGVGMPGHFLVRDQRNASVFVDPFGGGTLLDPAGCEAIFHALHGAEAPFDEGFLAPASTPTVLARMLANLRSVFLSRGDRQSLLWVLQLRTLLPDSSAEDRADFAAGLASLGRFDAAATEYDVAADGLGGSLGAELRRNAVRLRARLN